MDNTAINMMIEIKYLLLEAVSFEAIEAVK